MESQSVLKKALKHIIFLSISLLFICLVGCKDKDDPQKDVSQKDEDQGKTDFETFLETARFMPENPLDMTEDDKKWFSENAVMKVDMQVEYTDYTVTKVEQQRSFMYLEATWKTFNYMTYTKSVAKAIHALFEDRPLYIHDEQELPSAVGTILALRGLDMSSSSQVFKPPFKIRFRKEGVGYLGSIRNGIPFSLQKDNYTEEDLKNGKRASHLQDGDKMYGGHMVITLKNALEDNYAFRSSWEFPNAKERKEYGKQNEKVDFGGYAGQGIDLTIFSHELFHAYLQWNHNKRTNKERQDDAVYALSSVYGHLFHLGGPYKIMKSVDPPVPMGGFDAVAKIKQFDELFGGHLPMAHFVGLREFHSYNIQNMYLANKFDLKIYNPDFTKGTIHYASTPEKLDIKTKSVPPNPFEGINWQINIELK